MKTLTDGALLSALASLYLMSVLLYNPRLFLQDYPTAIQNQVPPKTEREKRQSLLIGIPFLVLLFAVPFLSTLIIRIRPVPLGAEASYQDLFLHAFGVLFVFNLVDLLVLDWLVFCTITPRFVVIPGTEGDPAYKDYRFHFRAFLVGTLLSLVAGLIIGGIVILL
jgi:hypothetical protein